MNEKELVTNLAALQSVTPDADWVKKNREVLSYQIFNGNQYADTQLGFFALFSLWSKRLLQPSSIAVLIVLFFAASGVVGLNASRNSAPGEPLYIAKTISEKAQFAMTFNEKARARLNVEFASERVAELEKISNSASAISEDPRVKELTASFKQELDSARTRLDQLKKTQTASATVTAKQKNNQKEEDSTVFSAEAGKDSNGIDIAMPDSKALEEVEKLFNEKKYTDAATKLEQIGQQLQK